MCLFLSLFDLALAFHTDATSPRTDHDIHDDS